MRSLLRQNFKKRRGCQHPLKRYATISRQDRPNKQDMENFDEKEAGKSQISNKT